jgi:hypothetical protein
VYIDDIYFIANHSTITVNKISNEDYEEITTVELDFKIVKLITYNNNTLMVAGKDQIEFYIVPEKKDDFTLIHTSHNIEIDIEFI